LALAPDYDLHHQTIAALASMNLRLHNLLSAGLDQIFVLDREQRMVAFFGHWPKESPWALEELLGKRKRDVFGADKAAIHEAATLRALKGEEVSYEWTVKDKVRLTYLFTTASPLRTDAGVVTGVLLVTRNVTPLKQEQLAIQQALREKTDQLAEVELSVKRIAATLRPPASAVEPASTSRLHTNAFLSKREREVLSLLQRGLRPRTIAQTLGLSVETVRHNVKTMFRKTGVHSQEALVRLFSDPVDRRGQAERSRGA
jgi:PAS domain S-box-containing protein